MNTRLDKLPDLPEIYAECAVLLEVPDRNTTPPPAEADDPARSEFIDKLLRRYVWKA